ncbi:MAG: SIR2 family protein [Proteobacteria bacterium]|nr:SIR2 family protein [Pseudomonadota bacterium]
MAGYYYPPSLIIDQALKRIVQALNDRDAQFLFGAGMSASCEDRSGNKVPTGFELSIELLKEFFPPEMEEPPDKSRLEELATYYPFECIVEAIEGLPGLGRLDLTNKLKNFFVEPDYSPSSAHIDFQSVCLWGGIPRFNQVFTTNFDLILEKILGDKLSASITEKNAKEIKKSIQKGKICIIHLHGRLEEDDYKITEKDVYNKSFSVLRSEFRNALTTSDAFVFVGYSMNDPDFRDIYMQYRNEILERNRVDKKTYVVNPVKSKHHYELGSKIWESRGAILIPLESTKFFARLKTMMESQLKRAFRVAAMAKYGYKDEFAFNEFVKEIADLFRISNEDAIIFLNENKAPGSMK